MKVCDPAIYIHMYPRISTFKFPPKTPLFTDINKYTKYVKYIRYFSILFYISIFFCIFALQIITKCIEYESKRV